MLNRFETFMTKMNQMNRSIQLIKNREMEKYGLKGTHVMCLYQLKQHPEGLTAKDLATLCGEDKAAISRTLCKLESKDMVFFTDVEGKKRYRTTLTLTNQGMQVCNQISEKIEELLHLQGDEISEQEREIFYKVFTSVADRLQEISNLPA